MNQLQEAAVFYKNNILPYVFILETPDNYFIVIYPEKRHFLHLTGVQHSLKPNLKLISTRFYNDSLKGNISMNDFISNEGINNIKDKVVFVNKEDKWIYNRITRFEEIFVDVFLNSFNKAIKFNKKNSDETNIIVNYFAYDITNIEGRYLGIKEEIDNKAAEKDYFKFSSIIFDDEEPNRLLIGQKQIIISKVYKMTKNEYHLNKNKFSNSIKYKPTKTQIDKNKSIEDFVWDNTTINKINNLLTNGFKISKGEFKKNSISLKKDNKIIERDMYEKCKKMQFDEIVSYINSYINK